MGTYSNLIKKCQDKDLPKRLKPHQSQLPPRRPREPSTSTLSSPSALSNPPRSRTCMESSLMPLSHTRSTNSSMSAHLKLSMPVSTPPPRVPTGLQLPCTPRDSKTSQSSSELETSSESTEPLSVSTTTADNSTSPCTSLVPGLSSPPTRPQLLVPPPEISSQSPSLVTAQPLRSKTPPSSPTCADGSDLTSVETMSSERT